MRLVVLDVIRHLSPLGMHVRLCIFARAHLYLCVCVRFFFMHKCVRIFLGLEFSNQLNYQVYPRKNLSMSYPIDLQ